MVELEWISCFLIPDVNIIQSHIGNISIFVRIFSLKQIEVLADFQAKPHEMVVGMIGLLYQSFRLDFVITSLCIGLLVYYTFLWKTHRDITNPCQKPDIIQIVTIN